MKRLHVGSIAAVVALASVVSACGEATPAEDLGTSSSDLTTITRSAALARGELWVAAKVPYCQSANHQPDGDKACAATCSRPNNAQWDPFRSDCSGFVSWSWGLAAPGRTTAELAPAVKDITHTIDPKTLMPADAVNKPSDHTMLFVKWITPGTRATFMEEPGCSAAQPYARTIDSDVTISGMSITVKENGKTFSAIRFDAIVDDPDAGALAAADAGTAPNGAGDDGAGGVTSSTDAAPMTPSPMDDAGGFNPQGPTHEASGCATTPDATASDAWPLALGLAFVAARRRRRSRAAS